MHKRLALAHHVCRANMDGAAMPWTQYAYPVRKAFSQIQGQQFAFPVTPANIEMQRPTVDAVTTTSNTAKTVLQALQRHPGNMPSATALIAQFVRQESSRQQQELARNAHPCVLIVCATLVFTHPIWMRAPGTPEPVLRAPQASILRRVDPQRAAFVRLAPFLTLLTPQPAPTAALPQATIVLNNHR